MVKEYKELPCRIAGKINNQAFNEKILKNNILNKADLKNISLANAYALAAAYEAFNDAHWVPETEDEQIRTGVSIATGMSGVQEIADAALALSKNGKGYRGISPYFVPKILPNLSAGLISIKYKLKVNNYLNMYFHNFILKLFRVHLHRLQLHVLLLLMQ